jgi:hypothetical protein
MVMALQQGDQAAGPSNMYILDLGSGSWLQITSGEHVDNAPDWR